MGKGYMAICGKDMDYITGIYDYISVMVSNEYEAVLFTKKEAFEHFCEENVVDLLLEEEGFSSVEENVTKRIVLSEEIGKENTIYKYMACDRIYKEIMAICAAGTQAKVLERQIKHKELIGVYTPIKRCFQTTFSLTLGQIIAKKRKTLYLNFESFSGFETMMSKEAKTDLLDLVYFSECNQGDFSCRVESLKEKIGSLDYISPVKAYAKYSEVSKSKWERLIDNLLSKTDYEVIILDLSEQVNGLLDILKKCSRVYTIVDSDKMASAKVTQYENLLRESFYEEIVEKTQNITIPKFKDIPSNFEMLTHSELADYIKKLVEGYGE